MRVLAVDDDPIVREAVAALLADLDHDHTVVASGREALERLDRTNCDLVLTDIRMPGMDGLELLRTITARKQAPPVVLLTAYADAASAAEALRLGAFDYLEKPVSIQALEACLARLQREQALRRELEREQREHACAETEKERERHARELALTLDTTSDGIWTWDFQRDELSFSDQYYRMLGYEPGAFPPTFESWVDRVHPDDREDALAVASAWLETKPEQYENEFRLRTRDGGYRWIRARARVVERDADGRAIRMIGNHEDITERKQAEAMLQAANETHQALLDASDAPAMLIDAQAVYLAVNEPCAKALQTTPDALIGRNAFDLLPDDVAAGRRARVEEAIRTRRVVEFEDARAGRILSNRLVPVVDAHGHVTRVAVFSHDITEHKQAAVAMQRSEEKFRKLFELGLTGMAIETAEGDWLDVNDKLCYMLGYSRAELLQKHWTELTHPDDLEKDLRLFRELTAGQRHSYSIEKRFLRKDGETVHWQIAVSRSVTPDGRTDHVYAAAIDITERIQLESEVLAAAQEERERIGQDLHDGHGQQLAGLAMMADALERRLDKAESGEAEAAKRMAQELWNAKEGLRAAVRGISPVDPNEGGLAVALEDLAEATASRTGIACSVETAASVPVQDPVAASELFRVAQEALANSVRHSRARTITICLAREADTIRMEMRDDGRGFAPEETSTGVGLRSMRLRAERLGGSFDLASQPGRGTTLRVSVPDRGARQRG